MKKFVSLFCASLLAFLLVASPVSSVFAAESTNVTNADDCECHDVTPIEGSEKYQIILKVILSKEFLNASIQMLKDGYILNVTKEIEVVKHNIYGNVMVGVPFIGKGGKQLMAVFMDGKYMGSSDPNAPSH
jgi:hypothetical protein